MKTTSGSALTPRAFEHWEKKLTFGNRVETQFLQTLAKRPLQLMNAIVPGNNLRIGKAINWVERKIGALQESPYRYSPEFNQALVLFNQRNKWLTTIGAILPPAFFSGSHLIGSGDLPFYFLAASALWVISAFALSHVGTKISRKEMISEHLETERAQKDVKLKGALLDKASDAIFLHDETGRFYYINEAAWRTRGYTREELLALPLSQLDVPEYAALIEPRIREFMANGTSKFETAHRTKEGAELPLEVNLSRVNWEGKNLILSVTRDIVERKRAEDKIINQSILLNSMINSVPDTLIFALDNNYRYLAFNENHRQEMKKVYGVDIEIGKSMLDYINIPEVKSIAKASYDRVLNGESVTDIHEQPGLGVWYEFSWGPIRSTGGKITGITCFIRNITERRRMEEEMQIAEKRVREGERQAAVGGMVGTISHALKNVLVELAGGLSKNRELLDRLINIFEVRLVSLQPGSVFNLELEKQAMAITRELAVVSGISEEGLQVTDEMIRNMLSFSRSGIGESGVILVKEDLVRTLQMMGRVTLQNQISLDVDLHGLSGKDGVYLPANALQDIIRNLVNNSIEAFDKKTKTEEMAIRVVAERDGKGQIKITVEDNGAGIPANLRDQLFKQVVVSPKRGGTGIGLNMVGEIVRLAGGQVEMQSELGKGTKITITLPYRVKEEKASGLSQLVEPKITPELAGQYTIMLIDDMPAVLQMTEGRLRHLGFKVESYLDAKQALKRYIRMEVKPDLVLTDQSMPDMYGHELIAQMRAVAETKFAVYSGNLELEDKSDPLRLAIDAGAYFIPKGAKLSDFDLSISRIFLAVDNGQKKVPVRPAPAGGMGRNPISTFPGLLVHKINNILAILKGNMDCAMTDAEAAGMDRVRVEEDFKEGLSMFKAEYRALQKFAANEASLGQLATAKESKLPKSLWQDERFSREVWEKVPSGERFKLAVLVSLYLNSGLGEFYGQLEKYATTENIGMAEAKEIVAAIDRFQPRNNAAMLRGDQEDLIAKFREYFELLAISS